MRYYDGTLGMFGWRSDDLIVYGGTKAGGLHKDTLRLRFEVYDRPTIKAAGWEKAKLADLVLAVAPGTPPVIKGIIDIKLPPALRRRGHGTRIVDGLVEASGGNLAVHDIKRSAVGFWRKAGIELVRGGTSVEGVIDRRKPEPEDAPAFAP